MKELIDDKNEEYILSSIFSNNEIKRKTEEIYDIIEEEKNLQLWDNFNFLNGLYKKIWFKTTSKIWEDEKEEIKIMFFGTDINNKNDLEIVILEYSKNAKKFRSLEIEEKWIIFYLVEIVIERLININDIHYDFFKKSKKDRNELIKLINELIISWIDELIKNIKFLLSNHLNFFDKHLSFDENYLKDKELDWFRENFNEMINYMYIDLTSKSKIKNKINDIQKRIENKIILD